MVRNISFSAIGFTSGWVIVAIYIDDSLGTLVDSKSFTASTATNVTASFTSLQNQPYYVVIYSNTVNAIGGVIRNHFWFDASITSAVFREDLVLIADTTPGFSSGTTTYTDASLSGWVMSLERIGAGTLLKDVEWSFNTSTNTITLLPTLDNPTPNIQQGEKFVIHFQPQVVSITPPSATGAMFSDCYDITGDTTIDNSKLGFLALIAGTGDHLTITLPALSSCSENKLLGFNSEGGSHVNAIIKAAGTDTIKFLNGLQSQIILGQSEFITVFKKGSSWYVGPREGNLKSVGEIFDSYSLTELNTLPCAGQTISRVTYARLWSWVQTLDASMLISDANWSNNALSNKGKFSTGDGSTTFRLPLLYKTVDGSNNIVSTGFLEGVDGSTRKAGVYATPQVLDHKHSSTIGTLPSTLFGKLLASILGNIQIGNYYKTGTNSGTDLTSSPCATDGNSMLTVGKDNTPASTGVYKMIRI